MVAVGLFIGHTFFRLFFSVFHLILVLESLKDPIRVGGLSSYPWSFAFLVGLVLAFSDFPNNSLWIIL